MEDFEKLPNMNVKQSTFIQALAVGKTTQEACRIANISYKTGFQWKKEEGFNRALIKLKADFVNSNFTELLQSMNIAISKHTEILKSPNTITSQRLKAIEMLYNQARLFMDTEDIKQRMLELEMLYAERN